ncbi:complement component C1q receptor [Paroedura picta]|uniref:complement component C1q receptor n=1 Tax=Paroedura picta TaxID=143630 RepID=UPI004055A57A
MAILLQTVWQGLLLGLVVQTGQAAEALCSESSCYTLHWGSLSWLEAQKKCQDNGGNLATLKKPEEARLAGQLLATVPGWGANPEAEVRLWIGLHREKGKCYQGHQLLRGFTWVAGDAETEYSNWAHEPRETCTAQRCVTLQGPGLAWVDGHCSRPAQGKGGYLCRFSFQGMCRPLALAGPGAVKYTTPFGIVTASLLAVPFGSTAEVACGAQGAEVDNAFLVCKMQASTNGNTFEWNSQGPLCASPSHGCGYSNGGCEHQCLELGRGVFRCACHSGYQLGGDRLSCIPVDYCSSNPCQGQCLPHTGGFHCLCPSGYVLAADGQNCVDVDECAAPQEPCQQTCINTLGSFTCLCQPGYKVAEADGQACQDIDECAGVKPCSQLCANTLGSFLCSCKPGYQLEGINSSSCLDVDECLEEPCEHICKNLLGSYHCFCQPGWRLAPDGISCTLDATTSTPTPTTQGELWDPMDTRPGSGPPRQLPDSPIQAELEQIFLSPGTTLWPEVLSRPLETEDQAVDESAQKNTDSSKQLLYYIVGGVVALLVLLACVLILVTFRKMKVKKAQNEARSAADNYSWVPDQREARAGSNEYIALPTDSGFGLSGAGKSPGGAPHGHVCLAAFSPGRSEQYVAAYETPPAPPASQARAPKRSQAGRKSPLEPKEGRKEGRKAGGRVGSSPLPDSPRPGPPLGGVSVFRRPPPPRRRRFPALLAPSPTAALIRAAAMCGQGPGGRVAGWRGHMGPLGLLPLLLAATTTAGAEPPPPPPPPPTSSAQCLDSRCFGLFWEARSFAEAGAACQRGGGRLMWALSSVEAEAIDLLRRGRAGGVWLGLRLAAGRCVEASRPLRGFQWEAGDERTNYEAWARGGPAEDTCGPRCVVVSGELRWEERACEAAAAGFLCEYSYAGGPCAPLALPPGAAARYATPFGARDADLSAFPPATRAEVPGLRVALECRQRADGSWGWAAVGDAAPGAWACQLEGGGCEGACREDGHGRPRCTCPDGAVLGPDGRRCLSPCAALQCEHLCQPHGERALCMCEEGYRLGADGRSCADIDDCRAEPGPCSQQCVNTPGGFRCQCFPDYTLAGGSCIKTANLCFQANCQQECVVVNGTSLCTCFQGFVPHPKDPQQCVKGCNRTECPAQCDPHTGDSCYCPDGYILQEFEDGTKVCTDIDECSEGYCDGPCRNLHGSYECATGRPDVGGTWWPTPDSEGSGDLTQASTALPILTPVPPSVSRSPGTLVAVIVSTVLSLVALAAVAYCLLTRLGALRTRTDYKCQQLETEVGLEQVRSESSACKQKM